jgi:hypothetical protein
VSGELGWIRDTLLKLLLGGAVVATSSTSATVLLYFPAATALQVKQGVICQVGVRIFISTASILFPLI